MKHDGSKQLYDLSSNISVLDDVRLIHDSDVISSDDSDNNNCDSKPKKYNQLEPRAHTIFKLLKSVKPKTNNIWKTVNNPQNSDCPLINGDLCAVSISSDAMAKNSNKRKRDVSSSEDQESTCTKKRKETVNQQDFSHSISSSDGEHSVKSHSKSKHKNKKLNRNPDDLKHKTVIRKDRAHSISSSGGEDFHETSSKLKHKPKISKKSAAETQTNYNGHLLTSGEEYSLDEGRNSQKSGKDLRQTLNKNKRLITGEYNNNINGLNEDSDNSGRILSEGSERTKSRVMLEMKSQPSREKLHHRESFTSGDEEEISKYSFLLSKSFIQNNNIWIMQCPRDLDGENLVKQYLDLSGTCQLVDGQSRFEVYSYRNSQSTSATLAVPSEKNHFQLCTIPIVGNIIVEESIEVTKSATPNIPEPPQRVELPENLRTRHPLLGLDYEKQPRTVVRIERIHKKKKKKQSKMHEENFDGMADPEQSFCSVEYSEKKKKKKHKSMEDLSMPGPEQDFSSVEHSKKKKKKRHKSTEDLSFQDSEINSTYDTEHARKKKKKSHRSTEHLNDISEQEHNLEESHVDIKVKRKKKKHSDGD